MQHRELNDSKYFVAQLEPTLSINGFEKYIFILES